MAHIVNKDGEKYSTNWHAGPNGLVKCPFPGCTHAGHIITKLHCRNNHDMEREEIGKLYGMAKVIEGKGAIMSQHNGRKWNNTGGGYLI